MLPWLIGRPTPWAVGWHAMWPSLTVHAVYGVVTAYVTAMPVDPMPRLKQTGANAW